MKSMKTIEELIREIRRPDERTRALAEARWNAVAKPLGSLGLFEEMIMRIAALKGQVDFRLEKKALVVFCAEQRGDREGCHCSRGGSKHGKYHGASDRLQRDSRGCGDPGLLGTSRGEKSAGTKRHRRHQPGECYDGSGMS